MNRVVIRHSTRIIAILIGPAILVVVVWRADVTAISQLLSAMRVETALAAFALVFVFHTLKAARWKVILRGQAIFISYLDCYLMYAVGLLFGLITPGRVGDFVKIWYVRRLGHGYGRSSVSVFADRFFDLLVLAIIGAISLVWFTQTSLVDNSEYFYLILGPPIFVCILLIAMATYWTPEAIESSNFNRFVQRWMSSRVLTQIIDFRRDFKAISPATWIWASLTTIGGWLLFWIIIFLLAMSLDLPLTYWQTTALFSLSSVASYLPVSLAGLGTREVIMIGLFDQIGLPLEQALVFSLSIFALNMIIVVEGSIGWLAKPLTLSVLRESKTTDASRQNRKPDVSTNASEL
jgi:uncharacterized protein (TIRG00374 family)